MSIWEASIFSMIVHWCCIQGLFHQGHVQSTTVVKCYSPPTCNGFNYDSHVNSCCSNQIYKGTGLCCCGKSSYNAIQDTCCNGNLTRGLSELVSLCCGSVAYNPLNEICCRSYVYPRQAHSGCCGKGGRTYLYSRLK
ncbi:galaxin-2-like [Scleropages formosus]|uniref:galaxin-2-like n=1 Tax=Scleropages formosus TaxID=113540 RepID=UPI000878C473|nr:galaxin-2-like [Scleropages formosus]